MEAAADEDLTTFFLVEGAFTGAGLSVAGDGSAIGEPTTVKPRTAEGDGHTERNKNTSTSPMEKIHASANKPTSRYIVHANRSDASDLHTHKHGHPQCTARPRHDIQYVHIKRKDTRTRACVGAH